MILIGVSAAASKGNIKADRAIVKDNINLFIRLRIFFIISAVHFMDSKNSSFIV